MATQVPPLDTAAAGRLPVNVIAAGGRLIVVAPVPGVVPEQIRVVLDGRRLRVQVEAPPEAGHEYLLHEWTTPALERLVELPADVSWPVTASVVNGLLTVALARSAEPPTGPIEITPSGDHPARAHLHVDVDLSAVDLRGS